MRQLAQEAALTKATQGVTLGRSNEALRVKMNLSESLVQTEAIATENEEFLFTAEDPDCMKPFTVQPSFL